MGVGILLSYIFSGTHGCSSAIEVGRFNNYTSSTVTKALDEHCDCIPPWMEGDVYFEPLVTLFLAFLAVIIMNNSYRVIPVVRDVIEAMFGTMSAKSMVLRFRCLPDHIQASILKSLKNAFPTMPNMTPDTNNKEAKPAMMEHGPARSPNEGDHVEWLLAELRNLRTEFDNRILFSQEEAADDRNEKIQKFRQILSLKLADIENEFKTTDHVGCGQKLPVELAISPLLEQQNEDMNPEFLQWVETHKKVFFKEVLASQEDQCASIERSDAAVMFFLELLLGIWVLTDYFAIQVWPTGSSWMCRWAYFSAVVMYKPFTIPMWFCLMLCCHYTFTDRLYNDYKRDKVTGTPFGAPFIRNKFTMFMVSVVVMLQFCWFMGTMIIAVPLMLLFFPVVVSLGFVFPFFSTQLPQKLIGWLKFLIRNNMGILYEEIEIDKLTKPIKIEESLFSLKAWTTQLVSLSVLCFILLSFLSDTLTWYETAREYLKFSFNFPRLMYKFRYTFSLPNFNQPRVSFQFAFGFLITAFQIIFRVLKRFLLINSSLILLEPITPLNPNQHSLWMRIETIGFKVFQLTSWGFFHNLMAAAQAAFEATNTEIRRESMIMSKSIFYLNKRGQEWRALYKLFINFLCWYVNGVFGLWKTPNCRKVLVMLIVVGFYLFIPLIWLLLFCYYLVKYSTSVRVKYFGEGTGEKELSEWSLSEDSMNYDSFSLLVGCSFNGSIPVILKRCPWLTFPTEIVTSAGDTPLLVAVANSALNVVEYLVNLEEEIDINARNKTGGGVLQIAARSGNVHVLNYVLAMELDADVNAEEKNGATALLHAAEVGFIEAVNALLQIEGIDVNHQTKDKWTALMLAACQGHIDVVTTLLRHEGMQLNLQNEYGDTALDLARKNKRPDIVTALELHLKGSSSGNLIMETREGVEKGTDDEDHIFSGFADLWENGPFS